VKMASIRLPNAFKQFLFTFIKREHISFLFDDNFRTIGLFHESVNRRKTLCSEYLKLSGFHIFVPLFVSSFDKTIIHLWLSCVNHF
jgi:hypothetical protein